MSSVHILCVANYLFTVIRLANGVDTRRVVYFERVTQAKLCLFQCSQRVWRQCVIFTFRSSTASPNSSHQLDGICLCEAISLFAREFLVSCYSRVNVYSANCSTNARKRTTMRFFSFIYSRRVELQIGHSEMDVSDRIMEAHHTIWKKIESTK